MCGLSKAVILGFLIGILGLVVSLVPVGLDLKENFGLDIFFKLRGTRHAPADVVIVSIDQSSAASLNLPMAPEKWPRSLHARLTANLVKAGAAVIVFDVMFDEARAPEDDPAFADAIRKARNVVLFEYLTHKTVSLTDARGAPMGVVHIERSVLPTLPLAQAAVALAPFPLPKVPVKVSQYWTFKTGSSDAPTLPVVAFQIHAYEVFDAFIRLLDKVSPSRA